MAGTKSSLVSATAAVCRKGLQPVIQIIVDETMDTEARWEGRGCVCFGEGRGWCDQIRTRWVKTLNRHAPIDAPALLSIPILTEMIRQGVWELWRACGGG